MWYARCECRKYAATDYTYSALFDRVDPHRDVCKHDISFYDNDKIVHTVNSRLMSIPPGAVMAELFMGHYQRALEELKEDLAQQIYENA